MDNMGKKPRLEVRKEAADHVTSRAVVVADASRPEMKAFQIFKFTYHCFSCSMPLKPPVFECRSGHKACVRCAEYHTGICGWCAAKYKRIPWLDPYLMAAKVPCPNMPFGCRSSVAYCLVEDHRLECPHAPCRCPDCDFRGSPPMLCDHLKAHHDWLVTSIAFDKNLDLKIHKAERWRLLATENGEHLFLLVISEGSGGGREIRVVHVGGKDVGPWRYWCKAWTTNPPVDPENGRRDPISHLEDRARSCTVPSEAAAMALGGRHLSVHLLDLNPGGEFALHVRITRYQLETASGAASVARPVPAGAD